MIQFWWRSGSGIRIRIYIMTLVRCALVEVCTVLSHCLYMSVEYFAIVKEVVVNVCQFQLGSLSMKPVIQFNAALSTMFDHVIDANSELRQQLVELKADCDRLAADRADAVKVLLLYACYLIASCFMSQYVMG